MTSLVTVKLASALSTRKDLTAKLAAYANTFRNSAGSGSPLATVLHTQTLKMRISPSDSLGALEKELPLRSYSDVQAEFSWLNEALRAVDEAIQQANWTAKVKVPASALIGKDGASTATTETELTLAQALLWRKNLSTHLAAMQHIGSLPIWEPKSERKSVPVQVGTNQAPLEEATLTRPKYDRNEFVEFNNRVAKAVRELDNAIQKANWEVDVAFDSEIEKGYTPLKPTVTK